MNPLTDAQIDEVRQSAITAAGGIIRGDGANEGKITVVRRRRYTGEIGLPKGKVQEKEDIIVAALREVKEETGYQAEIVEYAGRTQYQVGRKPKVVFYFVMRVPDASEPKPVDTEEIEAVEWVTPKEALLRLTHSEDRNLIAALFSLPRD
jgi:8-oxo-dGTP pyrophosphatase MutT (NUDIX family)